VGHCERSLRAICLSVTVLMWHLEMLWQFFSSVGGLLDAAGEKIRYFGCPCTWGEVVKFSIRFAYDIRSIHSIEVVSILVGTSLVSRYNSNTVRSD
jgi:hypothetical protein